jgi:phosphoribosylformylglycinamidine synthase PurS subunit
MLQLIFYAFRSGWRRPALRPFGLPARGRAGSKVRLVFRRSKHQLRLLRAQADSILKGMKVNVIVKPKEAVLDPQGNAVRDAMRHLGMPEVRSVRIGKFMEIDVDGDDGDLEKRLHGLCRDLLSNPVIEDYELEKNSDK